MEIKVEGHHSFEKIDVNALARAYQTIYGARPWGEYKKCSTCDVSWSIEDYSETVHQAHQCENPLIEDYWTQQYLLNHFNNIVGRNGFAASVAHAGENIVGFAWGYEMSLDSIDEELNIPGLSQAVVEKYGNDKKIVYLADLAVDNGFRNKGLAKELTKIRHKVLLENDAEIVLTRTKGGDDPSVTHLWYEKIGFNVLIDYNDARLRVIRGIPIKDLSW